VTSNTSSFKVAFFHVAESNSTRLAHGKRTPSNTSVLEVKAKNDSKVEISSERRRAYNSIKERRAYFKRQGDATRAWRKPARRRVDPERDVLELQETVHRPQVYSFALPKLSVYSNDNSYHEFGLKLPKKGSTKLSLVEGWGTTSLPADDGDVDNLIMPPGSKISPKLSRLINPGPSALPLSLDENSYPQ